MILIYSVLFAYVPCTSSIAARAETPATGSYACILENAYFYAEEKDTEGLFLLPKTYYVKLLSYGEDYCKIEYGDSGMRPLTGYAKTSLLTFVPYQPARPYLSYTFEIKYTIGNDTFTNSGFLTEITATCVYYGDYELGSKTYCYVLRGEEFGYVPKPYSLSYEENGEYAAYLTSLQPETKEETDNKKSSPAQVAILIALCLLVPVLAALILKPPRRPPYETDEY